MSAIPADAWAALDLFWFCHQRVPGLSGWVLQRTGYPAPGAALQQDAWTLWAWQALESAFYAVQGEVSEEHERGKELAKLHEHTRRGGLT